MSVTCCIADDFQQLFIICHQVESLRVQLNAANYEKCQLELNVSRLAGEIDRKVLSIFHIT